MRTLSPYESFFWLFGRNEPFLVQWTLMVSGYISLETVKKSLLRLQQRHPLLNHTISTTQPFVFEPITKPIRLTEHPRQNDLSWQKVATQALALVQPLSPDETFLTLDWVHAGMAHEFIFTMDHAFADLRGLTGLGQDFLNMQTKITPYPFRPPINALLPEGKKPATPSSFTIPWSDQHPISPPPYQYHMMHIHVFSEAKTAEIAEYGRKHQCRVHAVLCTAMTIALNEYLMAKGINGETFILTPANLRPYFNTAIADSELGNFVSNIFHPFKIGKVEPFITRAQSIAQQIQDAYETDGFKNATEKLSSIAGEALSSIDVVNILKIREGVGVVSNVGNLSFPIATHLQLKGARLGLSSPMMSGCKDLFWMAAETIQGRLQLEFVKLDSHNEGVIEDFAARVIEILNKLSEQQ